MHPTQQNIETAIAAALTKPPLQVTRIVWDEALPAPVVLGKSPGVKRTIPITVCFSDCLSRQYVLKHVPEDGVRVQEGEGVVALHRLARARHDCVLLSLYPKEGSGSGWAVGTPQEVWLLEPVRMGVVLAEHLAAALAAPDDTAPSAAVETIAHFLKALHQPVAARPHQYVRELFGGSFGIMATLDAYPETLMCGEVRHDILDLTTMWPSQLLQKRCVRIHGDFHPWNIFWQEDSRTIDTTGGLHTPYGFAEDDLACIGVNLAVAPFFSQTGSGDWSRCDAWLRSLCATYPLVSDSFGFFAGWRLLVIANPLHYPALADSLRNRLLRAAMYCFCRRSASAIYDLLREAIVPENPWVHVDTPVVDRAGGVACDALSPGMRIDSVPEREQELARVGESLRVAGRVMALRRHRKTLFGDLVADQRRLQFALARGITQDEEWAKLLACGDFVILEGVMGKSESGTATLFVSGIRGRAACRLEKPAYEELFGEALASLSQSRVLSIARRHFQDEGFQEQITASLSESFTGGRSRPFHAWEHAGQRRVFLRVSSELVLKRKIASGVLRCYEIGSMFRNEGRDRRHLPEFLMLEAYAAFMHVDDMVEIVCDFLRKAVPQAATSGVPVALSAADALSRYANVAIGDVDGLARQAVCLGLPIPHDADSRLTVIHALLRNVVAPKVKGILAVTDLPVGRSPLTAATDGRYQRAWLFVDGLSIADVAQEDVSYERVKASLLAQFNKDRYPALRDYRRFLNALAAGLPPCAGAGISLSRVQQLALGESSIKAVALSE